MSADQALSISPAAAGEGVHAAGVAGEAQPPLDLPALPPAQPNHFRRLMLSFGPDRLRAGMAVGRGDQARDRRDWRTAAYAYAEGLAINPQLTHIWVQFGHALKEAGDPRAAEGAYRVAADQDPTNADTFLNLGHALKLQGRMTDAGLAYMRALDIEGLARDSTRELAGLVHHEHDFSLEALAEALGAGPADQTDVVLHVTRLVEALFTGAPSPTDLACMALVVELVESGEDVVLCGGRRAALALRRLPASLLVEAFRAALAGRTGEPPANDLLTLLNLIASAGAPCDFADGAVIVDFAGQDADGAFDQQLRALRRVRAIRTLVYLPGAAQVAADAAIGRELFAAMPQTLGVLVDREADAATVLQWAAGRNLNLRREALFVLSPDGASRAAAIGEIARRFAGASDIAPPSFAVRPDVYYGLGLDPEAETSAAAALARCGEGWWWPDHWGCWTRAGGASLLIEPVCSPGDYELLVGLRSSLEGECRFAIKLDNLDADEGVLPAARTDWRAIGVTLDSEPFRLQILCEDTHQQGPGGADASIGVIGFALRPHSPKVATDVVGDGAT
jgi:tetratricopeptide (TPR) repeat protein